MNIQFDTTPHPAAGPKDTASPQPRAAPTPAPAPAAQAAAVAPSAEIIKQVARQINDFLKSSASDVEFAVDSRSNKVVVRVVDSQTQQVLRQMPSEEMIAISKSLDQMSGLLIKQKA